MLLLWWFFFFFNTLLLVCFLLLHCTIMLSRTQEECGNNNCPHCGEDPRNRTVFDFKLVCRACGTICEDYVLDVLSAEAASVCAQGRSSCMMPPMEQHQHSGSGRSPEDARMFPKMNSGTIIRPSHATHHVSGSSGMMRRVQERHLWSHTCHRERTMMACMKQLFGRAAFTTGVSVPEIAIEDAKAMFGKVMSKSRGNKPGIMAACVYEALKRNHTPRTSKEIADMFDVSLPTLTKSCKIVRHAFEDASCDEPTAEAVAAVVNNKKKEVASSSSSNNVTASYMLNKLRSAVPGCSDGQMQECRDVLRKAQASAMFNCAPHTMACTCMCVVFGADKECKKRLCEAAGVSAVTVAKHAKAMSKLVGR